MELEDFGDDPDIDKLIFGATAYLIYNELIRGCQEHVKQLTTVQFDPETGIRRHFFNGKLEHTVRVRGIQGE